MAWCPLAAVTVDLEGMCVGCLTGSAGRGVAKACILAVERRAVNHMDSTIIQQIVAPAAMIPACGLLLLSSTARMNTVLSRIRAFHHERLDVWKEDPQPGSRAGRVRELRLEGLEHQTHRLLRRAELLRASMLMLIVAVACNLLSVIGLAAGFVVEHVSTTLRDGAAAVFVAGVIAMVGAMVTSFLEVFRITETVTYEHKRVEALCAEGPLGAQSAMDPAPPVGTGL